ncbi:MAG: hypothetical protein K2X82_12935, partial [Gemmataceae bacterium]|nr:hypothetical protein [Gemmataceae bacterium]
MADFSQAALGWLAHTAAAGAAVLLVGWLAVRATRGAAGRHRLAAGAFRAAVLVPVLCLFPAWLTVRLPAGWAGTAAHRAADPTPVAPAVGPFDDLRDAEPADLPTAGEFPLAYDPADRPAEFAPLSAVPAPAAP